MQRPTAKHQAELKESCGRVGDRIERAGEVKDITRRPTESSNLDPWGLTETEPPTKEHAGADPTNTLVADVQLGLHLGLLTIGAEATSDSVPCH